MRKSREEIPAVSAIPLAQVVSVEEQVVSVWGLFSSCVEGSSRRDEEPEVSRPMPISDDYKRTKLNLETFGHRSVGRLGFYVRTTRPVLRSRETNGHVSIEYEIKNNCIYGLEAKLHAYQQSIIRGESYENSLPRQDQVTSILQRMKILFEYFTKFYVFPSQESFALFNFYMRVFKGYVEAIKNDIKAEYRFSDHRNSRVFQILSDYTSNNRVLMNNYSHPTRRR